MDGYEDLDKRRLDSRESNSTASQSFISSRARRVLPRVYLQTMEEETSHDSDEYRVRPWHRSSISFEGRAKREKRQKQMNKGKFLLEEGPGGKEKVVTACIRVRRES